MNRTIITLLALVLLVALAGCSSSDTADEGTDPSTEANAEAEAEAATVTETETDSPTPTSTPTSTPTKTETETPTPVETTTSEPSPESYSSSAAYGYPPADGQVPTDYLMNVHEEHKNHNGFLIAYEGSSTDIDAEHVSFVGGDSTELASEIGEVAAAYAMTRGTYGDEVGDIFVEVYDGGTDEKAGSYYIEAEWADQYNDGEITAEEYSQNIINTIEVED